MAQIRQFGLRTKLILIIGIYTMAAFAMVSVFVNHHFQTMLLENYQSWVQQRAQLWLDHIGHQVQPHEPIFEIEGQPKRMIHHSLDELLGTEEVAIYLTTGERLNLLQTPSAQNSVFSEQLNPTQFENGHFAGNKGYSIYLPLFNQTDSRLLCLHYAYPHTMNQLFSLYKQLAIILLVLVLLAILLTWTADRTIVKPVLTLTDAVIRTGEGHFDQTVVLHTGDELEVLGTRFEEMLDRIRIMQDMALDASPLTALPGNNSIQHRIEHAIATEEDASVVYVDIDNFKAFNDVYGIKQGDCAIQMTADVLHEAAQIHARDTSFIGHVGGDDFMVVLPAMHASRFAEEVCSCFEEKIGTLYRKKDLKQGGIRTRDRQGVVRDFPLMSLSMAGVPLGGERFSHFSEVASIAAELKKAAKKTIGNTYVTDKRSGQPAVYARDTDQLPHL